VGATLAGCSRFNPAKGCDPNCPIICNWNLFMVIQIFFLYCSDLGIFMSSWRTLIILNLVGYNLIWCISSSTSMSKLSLIFWVLVSVHLFNYHICSVNYILTSPLLPLSGQGIVMNRSLYSDFVFLNTMAKHGFVSENGM